MVARLGVGGNLGYRGYEPEKKVLYNVHKGIAQYQEEQKDVVGGGGAIFEPKTLSMYLKKGGKRKNKTLTKSGCEPTTSGLEKPALLSTRLNTIIAITKYE